MNPNARTTWSKLVIVEGIMGSGKSTTVLRLSDRLAAAGIPSLAITEGVAPHPIRFDWDMPWEDVDRKQLAESAVAKWRSFVNRAQNSAHVQIVDGQLFHGNFTSLFLLEASLDALNSYVGNVLTEAAPMQPLLVYFHQYDIADAVRWIAARRGEAWVQYQTEWKLTSPYAVRRGLAGLDGLISLYRDYRALTDQIFAGLSLPKLSIETSQRAWGRYEAFIDDTLMHASAPAFKASE